MSRSVTSKLVRLLAAVALVAALVPASGVQAVTCSDVHVVWARGSLQGEADAQGDQFINEDLFKRIDPAVSRSQYRLGTGSGFGGFDYPATGSYLDWIVGGYMGLGGAYADSVDTGRQELVAYMEDRAIACPNEVLVLGGWSQGAQLVGEGLGHLGQPIRDRIAYVALWRSEARDGKPRPNLAACTACLPRM